MNRKEWKILIVIILIFASIGGIYLGRNYHKKKNEEEYVPDYLKNAGKEDKIPPKVYGVNEYSIVNIENKDMAYIYLRDFYNLMLQDINAAYELLEDDFRKEKYPTLESFQNFANTQLENYNTLKIVTKTVSSSQNTYIYDIITESGINYFFKAKGVMVYNVRFENK